jgi:hypothetical protein
MVYSVLLYAVGLWLATLLRVRSSYFPICTQQPAKQTEVCRGLSLHANKQEIISTELHILVSPSVLI